MWPFNSGGGGISGSGGAVPKRSLPRPDVKMEIKVGRVKKRRVRKCRNKG